ncbi:MAG: SPOR domain-containing protein [Sulfurospirillum sp.]
MENKNELSDIVLEKDDGKILKAKRVLIIIAILIILFLVVILSMKLFNSPANNKTSDLVLPPEPTSNVQNIKKNEELFKQVPIIEKNTTKKDNFENIVKNLKEKETKNKQAPKVKNDAQIQPVVKPLTKSKITKIKPSIKKSTVKTKKILTKNGTYIQVGATSKHSPNKKFLNKISSQKFHYRLLPITIKGRKITKILIGPFDNRKIAKENLAKVKKNFNKNAFIYIVK